MHARRGVCPSRALYNRFGVQASRRAVVRQELFAGRKSSGGLILRGDRSQAAVFAGGLSKNVFSGESEQSFFQMFLNAGAVQLFLPAEQIGSVVFYGNFVTHFFIKN